MLWMKWQPKALRRPTLPHHRTKKQLFPLKDNHDNNELHFHAVCLFPIYKTKKPEKGLPNHKLMIMEWFFCFCKKFYVTHHDSDVIDEKHANPF